VNPFASNDERPASKIVVEFEHVAIFVVTCRLVAFAGFVTCSIHNDVAACADAPDAHPIPPRQSFAPLTGIDVSVVSAVRSAVGWNPGSVLADVPVLVGDVNDPALAFVSVVPPRAIYVSR
jgi:hypothetical protein